MVVLKLLALVVSLGMDTLLLAISLGMTQRGTVNRWKVGLTFAVFEGSMPLFGFGIGRLLGSVIGRFTGVAGGIILLCFAIWLIFFEKEQDEKRITTLRGWVLIISALSVSIDELIVGFSLGVIGIPIVTTVFLIAFQALLFTVVGITWGTKLRPFFGEWAEKLVGIVLFALGLFVLYFSYL